MIMMMIVSLLFRFSSITNHKFFDLFFFDPPKQLIFSPTFELIPPINEEVEFFDDDDEDGDNVGECGCCCDNVDDINGDNSRCDDGDDNDVNNGNVDNGDDGLSRVLRLRPSILAWPVMFFFFVSNEKRNV